MCVCVCVCVKECVCVRERERESMCALKTKHDFTNKIHMTLKFGTLF